VEDLVVNRKILKFAHKVKEIDRQYEKNNNCELDNGVYNKAVEDESLNGETKEAGQKDDQFEGIMNIKEDFGDEDKNSNRGQQQ
jgi:hypothetical protein